MQFLGSQETSHGLQVVICKYNFIRSHRRIMQNMKDKNQSSSAAQYKFSQIFGYKGPSEKVMEEDIISATRFDLSGNYLAVGDKAGRVIVFEGEAGKKGINYDYFTEFQSHVKEFDTLRSMEVQEEIVDIQWLKPQGKYQKICTTNARTVKIWKMFEKTQKKVVKSSGKDLTIPKLQIVDSSFGADLQKQFPGRHISPINSVSVASNQEYLLSSDDCQVFLWSLDRPTKPYIPVNYFNPDDEDEEKETITCSTFHPSSDSLILHAMNKGSLKLTDLRTSAGQTATSFGQVSSKKNYIYELLSSHCDAKFIRNGKHIVSRDCLSVKLWDLCSPKKPVTTVLLNEGYKSKLGEMVENECIFDKFTLSASGDGATLLTGSYSNNFHLVDIDNSTNIQYQLNYKKSTVSKPITKGTPLGRVDYGQKTVAGDFNPKNNLFVVASKNCFFTYKM